MTRLEFKDDRSHKFYEVSVVAAVVTTRWGKVGSDGQRKSKELSSPQVALLEADKLMQKKIAKGYLRCEPTAEAAMSPEAAPQVVASETSKAELLTPPSEAAVSAETCPTLDEQQPTMRLEFSTPSSQKFWTVSVQGNTVNTRWGRLGSVGQGKSKPFASKNKALSQANKQLQAKWNKGYRPDGARTTVTSTSSPTRPTELLDGQSTTVAGSSGRTYTLRNTGGVFSCSCPAWLHQSLPIEKRTCKHLRAFRSDAAETQRIGVLPPRARSKAVAEGAPELLLAHSWRGEDPTGWWMSEKLDGVRAWWDGERFVSRLGNEFQAPKWFTESLPKQVLDGEIFGGRGEFQTTVSIARRQDRGPSWRKLRFLIFDAPTQQGTFEQRLAWAADQTLGAFASVLEHKPCAGEEHLRAHLANLEALGAEGVMLRAPGSLYKKGRSNTLLKVKTFHDAEATVIAHLPGMGKHSGRLGALRVRLVDGTEFKVGTGLSDAQRLAPPPIGAVITFRYQELTKAGVPRFPSFLRIRTDV